MTVAELIKKLEAYPNKDRVVLVDGYEGGFDRPNLREAYAFEQEDNPWYEGVYDELTTDEVNLVAQPYSVLKVLVISRM